MPPKEKNRPPIAVRLLTSEAIEGFGRRLPSVSHSSMLLTFSTPCWFTRIVLGGDESFGHALFVVGQRGLGVLAEIDELRRRIDRLLDFAVALHFELHAAGHNPEGRLVVKSCLEGYFHVN